MAKSRLSYEESLRRLQELGFLGADEHPPMRIHIPQPEDDEPLGLSFFRTLVGDDADFADLTIPRTLFGRSEICNASFANTDLTESNLRWNDFIDVDFTDAVLERADLGASLYTRCKFIRTVLRGADLRMTTFDHCKFEGALMERAMLTRGQGAKLTLTAQQRAVIDWRDDDGPEPSGG